jgi:DNA-binding MarR family transcriptional regulator
MYIHKYIGELSLASQVKEQALKVPALDQIALTLTQINEKLENLLAINRQLLKVNEALLQKKSKATSSTELNLEPDAMAILNLPLTLRKTIMVLYRLEKATADDLAKETNRLRAVESAAANQLVRMGYINKKRDGRDVYFYIEAPEENTMYG